MVAADVGTEPKQRFDADGKRLCYSVRLCWVLEWAGCCCHSHFPRLVRVTTVFYSFP